MNYTFREEVTKAGLDLQFVANNGQRNISPIVELIDDGDETVFDNTKLTTLASLILETYKPKWDKLGEIYDIQYDPIHNYLDQWQETDDIDGTLADTRNRIDTFTHGKTVTEDITRNDSSQASSTKSEDTSTTRTDNLSLLETRDLDSTSTVTDDFTEEVTYGKTEQRTDNLSESESKTESNTRTDSLQRQTTYNKTDTRTDNLTEDLSISKTDTRTDNLTEQMTYGKTNLRTDNLKHEIKGTETTTPSITNSNSVYAMNSSVALPTDSATQTGTQTLSFSNRENDDTGTQTDALSGSDTKTNTGTQQNGITGRDLKTNTGTQTSQLGGYDTTADTGTQQNALTGSSTILNTGTQSNVSSGNDVTENTGTRTTVNDEGGTVSKVNTGTQTLVGDNEETVTSTSVNSRAVHDVTGYTGADTSSEVTQKSRTTTNDIDKTGRHFGNIGNLTSQKQILEEINLWRWNYVNEILNDVKEFTTLPVYLDAMSYYD